MPSPLTTILQQSIPTLSQNKNPFATNNQVGGITLPKTGPATFNKNVDQDSKAAPFPDQDNAILLPFGKPATFNRNVDTDSTTAPFPDQDNAVLLSFQKPATFNRNVDRPSAFVQSQSRAIIITILPPAITTIALIEKKQSVAITSSEIFSGSVSISEAKQSIAVTASEVYSGSISLTEAKESISVTASEIFANSIALTENKQSISVTASETFAISSVALTQNKESISVTASETFSASISVNENKQSIAITATESFSTPFTFGSAQNVAFVGTYATFPSTAISQHDLIVFYCVGPSSTLQTGIASVTDGGSNNASIPDPIEQEGIFAVASAFVADAVANASAVFTMTFNTPSNNYSAWMIIYHQSTAGTTEDQAQVWNDDVNSGSGTAVSIGPITTTGSYEVVSCFAFPYDSLSNFQIGGASPGNSGGPGGYGENWWSTLYSSTQSGIYGTATQASSTIWIAIMNSFKAGTTVPIVGAITLNEGKQTISITASEVFSGSIAVNEQKQSISVTSSEIFSGSISAVEKKESISVTASETFSGSIVLTEKKQSIAIVSSEVFSGSISLTENKQSIAITSAETFSGAIGMVEKKQSVALTSSETFTASIALTEQKQAISITANETTDITGSITLVENKQSISITVENASIIVEAPPQAGAGSPWQGAHVQRQSFPPLGYQAPLPSPKPKKKRKTKKAEIIPEPEVKKPQIPDYSFLKQVILDSQQKAEMPFEVADAILSLRVVSPNFKMKAGRMRSMVVVDNERSEEEEFIAMILNSIEL